MHMVVLRKRKRGFLEGHAEVGRTRLEGGHGLHALVHGLSARVGVGAG